MTNILIGMPTFKRDWILPKWIECIERQNYPKENLGFIFELGPDDDATHDILWDWQTSTSYKTFDAQIQMEMTHNTHEEGARTWDSIKYVNMVELRNSLLDRATIRSHIYDYYFSLDSDLLLSDPESLNKLVEAAQGKDVVSPLSYMTPHDTCFPSAMTWDPLKLNCARHLDQYHIGEIFKADVVMAAVFMSRNVYMTTRYRFHRQGEDIGFAQALNENGFQSYAAWNVYCPHIMHKYMLNDYIIMKEKDPRDPNFQLDSLVI